MIGRASSRIALSVLGVGALGVGAAALTGTGTSGPPRCAAYSYPTVEACRLKHTGSSTCRQDTTTGLWHPDRCTTSGSGTHPRTGFWGPWWWGGRGGTTSTPTTTSRPSTVVGRSSSGSPTTTSPGSTSSRGGFGSTGSYRSSGG